jgi:dihydrodipicolinate synthase/N-acetylneuraminate lyase
LTIQLCKEAAEAGADFAIVIASGYFAGALSKAALKKFFVDVGDASPIPVMVYNCELYGSSSASVRADVIDCRPRSRWWNRFGL